MRASALLIHAIRKHAAVADFTGEDVNPDFANQLYAKQNPKPAVAPKPKPALVAPKAAPAPRPTKPVSATAAAIQPTQKTAADTTPFYEDPANIGAAGGAALGAGAGALLSKKNKLRNALVAALAGGTAGYFAGPAINKAVPQIGKGLYDAKQGVTDAVSKLKGPATPKV
jgi:hypothetical protein